MAYGNGSGVANVNGPSLMPGEVYAAQERSGSSVGRELDALDKKTDLLDAAIIELFMRLDPVLSPAAPQPTGNRDVPAALASPAVLALRAKGYKLDAALLRLQELITRIEL